MSRSKKLSSGKIIKRRKKYKTTSLLPSFRISLGHFVFVIVSASILSVVLLLTQQNTKEHAAGSGIPAFQHVIFIIEENHDYNQIIGSATAPYINQLANKYGLATAFHAITHPSLPNYIALTSGGLQGITTDCLPGGSCSTGATNIYSELEQGGKTWKAYMESMPGNCDKSDSGGYVVHHNPPAYYTNLSSCAKNDVPYTQFATDLSGNALPTFSWIVPNVQNDMHSGSVQTGDSWLAKEVPAILSSTAFTNNGLLIITTDEGLKGGGTNQVFTIMASPLGKLTFKSAVAYDHYSLLRTIADGLGIAGPGSAANATPMSDFFGAGGRPQLGTSVKQPNPTGVSTGPTAKPTKSPYAGPTAKPTKTPSSGPTGVTKTPTTLTVVPPTKSPKGPTPTNGQTNPCPPNTGSKRAGANVGTFNPNVSSTSATPTNCPSQNNKDEKNTNKKNDKDTKSKSSGTKPDSIFITFINFFSNLFH